MTILGLTSFKIHDHRVSTESPLKISTSAAIKNSLVVFFANKLDEIRVPMIN
jgi:hypothetical protein